MQLSHAQQGQELTTRSGLLTGDAEQGIVWRDSRHYVRQYRSEDDLKLVMNLIDNELSEPYSIFTYRYFIYTWPNLCYLAFDSASSRCFGTVVSKLDNHRSTLRGYLAMLTVEKEYRGHMMGTRLVELAIEEMVRCNAEEVVLEAEVNNMGALKLYSKLGFIRDKRLYRYYLNGVDAYRLKLRLPRYGLLPFDDDGGVGEWKDMTGMEPTVQKLAIQ